MLVDRDALLRYGDEELRRQKVVVAYNRGEAWREGLELQDEGSSDIPADVAASLLDLLLIRWKGLNTQWSKLRGKRVLEIASGSASGKTASGDWYPHFARLCAINGADVVALDARPQVGIDRILFTSEVVDLVDAVLSRGLPSLPVLEGRKFDLIHSANFIGRNCLPQLPEQLSLKGVSLTEYSQALHDQAGSLLADGGIMNLVADVGYNQTFYTRQGSTVVELKKGF